VPDLFIAKKKGGLPRDRELVAQIHSIKRRVLPSDKVAFDAEHTARAGHADRFWTITLACQKEPGAVPGRGSKIGVRVIGQVDMYLNLSASCMYRPWYLHVISTG
jgi:hypothetical protein